MGNSFGTGFLALLFLLAIIFISSRMVLTFSIPPNIEVCQQRYGEDWTYQHYEGFGDTCVILDYANFSVKDRELFPDTHIYCREIKFFNLKDWNPRCNFGINKTGEVKDGSNKNNI